MGNILKEDDLISGALVRQNSNYAAFTTSVQIAHYFEAEHSEIMEYIERIISNNPQSKEYMANLFHKDKYEDKTGNTCDMYFITRGGVDYITYPFISTKAKNMKNMFTKAFDESEFKHCYVTSKMTKQIKELRTQVNNNPKPGTREFFAFAVKEADKVLTEYKDIVDSQTEMIRDQQEKLEKAQYAVAYTESMKACSNGMIMNELAKVITRALHNAGYEWAGFGGTTLFKYLREYGYLIKRKGNDYNTPTQKAMELNIFDVKYTPIFGDTSVFRKATVKANGKGQEYFIAHFIELYKSGKYIGNKPKKKDQKELEFECAITSE